MFARTSDKIHSKEEFGEEDFSKEDFSKEDFSKEDFVQALKSDGVYLRHHTTTTNWYNIERDGYLRASVTEVDDLVGPEYLPVLLAKYTPIAAVYFQLVKDAAPRFEPQDGITELFFTPDAISTSQFVLHPVGWHFGLDKRTDQYCSDPQLSRYTNIDLKSAYHNIRYNDIYDEMNEILITNNVPLTYCVRVF